MMWVYGGCVCVVINEREFDVYDLQGRYSHTISVCKYEPSIVLTVYNKLPHTASITITPPLPPQNYITLHMTTPQLSTYWPLRGGGMGNFEW